MKISRVDDHGVVEYEKWFLLLISVFVFVIMVPISGWMLYLAEYGSAGPIHTWGDATWTIWMSMTTIGFGDFYPATTMGRITIITAFMIGAVNFGMIISIINSMLGTDRTVQNRELRSLIAEQLRMMQEMENKLGCSKEVNQNSHNLDQVIKQVGYESHQYERGFLTAGRDSSGCYMISLEAFYRGTDTEVKRWIACDDLQHQTYMMKRLIDHGDEL